MIGQTSQWIGWIGQPFWGGSWIGWTCCQSGWVIVKFAARVSYNMQFIIPVWTSKDWSNFLSRTTGQSKFLQVTLGLVKPYENRIPSWALLEEWVGLPKHSAGVGEIEQTFWKSSWDCSAGAGSHEQDWASFLKEWSGLVRYFAGADVIGQTWGSRQDRSTYL